MRPLGSRVVIRVVFRRRTQFSNSHKAQIACADRSGAAETLKKAVSLARECKLEAEESAARALLAEVGNA